jgi:hypothetical protein
MKETFFERGDFPTVVQNGSEAVILTNPWVNGTKSAPFDQCENIYILICGLSWTLPEFLAFYLILDLAVGGTNGWFPDGNEKPWLDGSTSESPN